MPPLYIVEQGVKLSVEGRRLLVRRQEELLLQTPMAHTSAVILFGNIGITTPAIKRLLGAGIDVVFLTRDGSYEGRLVGPLSKFGALRQQQYGLIRDSAWCLKSAQHIVRGKILNMRTLLLRYNRDLKRDDVADVTDRLHQLAARAGRTTRLNALLGVEGSAAAAYFSVFRRLFKHDWQFAGRVRRPPTDPINVLLSFGYTLLARDLEASVALVGLDPYLGVMHTPEYGRPSLALDLAEEFRAIVVDSVVLRCLNNDLITPDDFAPGEPPARPLVLSERGRRRLIQTYEERMATTITHPVTGEKMIYRRAFEIQTRLMARCFREPGLDYVPFMVR